MGSTGASEATPTVCIFISVNFNEIRGAESSLSICLLDEMKCLQLQIFTCAYMHESKQISSKV